MAINEEIPDKLHYFCAPSESGDIGRWLPPGGRSRHNLKTIQRAGKKSKPDEPGPPRLYPSCPVSPTSSSKIRFTLSNGCRMDSGLLKNETTVKAGIRANASGPVGTNALSRKSCSTNNLTCNYPVPDCFPGEGRMGKDVSVFCCSVPIYVLEYADAWAVSKPCFENTWLVHF